MTVVTAPKREPDQERLGDEGFEQIQPVEVARDPNSKPGQEFTGDQRTLRQRSLDSSRPGPRRRAQRESNRRIHRPSQLRVMRIGEARVLAVIHGQSRPSDLRPLLYR